LSNLWHPALPNVSSCSLEGTAGIELQVRVLIHRQASVGKKVQLFSYHGMEHVKQHVMQDGWERVKQHG